VGEQSSRQWLGRMGGHWEARVQTSMAAPEGGDTQDDHAAQLALKEQQLVDAIYHRTILLSAVESGAELERCEQMLQAFGPLEPLEARIAELERRVHRVGERRAALFGSFYLGKAREERELKDLRRRLAVALNMRDRAARLRAEPHAVKAELEQEIAQLQARLNAMRARRGSSLLS
jgi:hypothetical protein